MKRREPSPLATWTLEHLCSGNRDEALAGDLLEVFRAGRSHGWYWRQVFGACVVSWFNSLRSRIPLLVFALAWSMLAPAWRLIIDRIESASRLYALLWRLEWPYSGLAESLAWVLLNIVFLWGGILLYFLFQRNWPRAMRRRIIRNAFLKAMGFLLPVYFVTFVLANLFAYPGLAIDHGSITPLGEVTDLHLWANMIRAPYLIVLIIALWGAVPASKHRLHQAASEFSDADPLSATLPTVPKLNAFAMTRFFGLMVGAGLINAMIAGLMVCRLPAMHAPDLSSILVTASMYVLIGTLGGIAGSWLYWKSPTSPFREYSPVPFPLFALVCAAGWVWVTPMLLLAEQVSPLTPLAAMIGAFVLAAGLRYETYPVFASISGTPWALRNLEGELFAESMHRAPFEPYGYIVAIGIYAAGAATLSHSNYAASMWLGLSAAVFAWNKTIPRIYASSATARAYRRAILRLLLVLMPAVAFTAWAMLDGIAHRNRIAAEREAAKAAQNEVKNVAPADPKASHFGPSGYESLILWPYPPKKELIAPVPPARPLPPLELKQPLILRFDGTYEYVQPPDKRPGPTAHQSHGTPLHVDIESNNNLPVIMDAHQNLARPIPTARCSEIDVEIENGDNRLGIVSLGLLLGDGLPGHEKTAYVGQQPIVSTELGNFHIKDSPVAETVRFAVPGDVKLPKFSEITVLVLPDLEHEYAAPRIAIREFRLLPR